MAPAATDAARDSEQPTRSSSNSNTAIGAYTVATASTAVVTPPTTCTRPRTMKQCVVAGCESLARSRGCCKAHGGGKRCNAPSCMLSDQGGGFCIRHGGGRRCEVGGCNKSAQSRRFCKAHGGGVRCRVDGCSKTSQGGGCCRAHGGGPRTTKLRSRRTSTATSSSADTGVFAIAAAAVAINDEHSSASQPSTNANGDSTTLLTAVTLDVPVSSPFVSTASATKTTIHSAPRVAVATVSNPQKLVTVQVRPCCIDGCGNFAVVCTSEQQQQQQLCDEHGTSVHFAASLLGMLAAEPA